MNVRGGHASSQFELFFDRLVPCVAGKKVWTDRAKLVAGISAGGKVSITDEAFTELCVLNYWNKWVYRGHAKWTDARAGNSPFNGWQVEAYTQFDAICKRIKQQREDDATLGDAARETAFLAFAGRKYGATGGLKGRRRNHNHHDGPELFHEL